MVVIGFALLPWICTKRKETYLILYRTEIVQECCPPPTPRSRLGRKGCLKALARNDGVVRATMKIRQHTDHKRWNATEMGDWQRCILGSPPLKKTTKKQDGTVSPLMASMFQRDVDDWRHSENIHSAEQSDTFS